MQGGPLPVENNLNNWSRIVNIVENANNDKRETIKWQEHHRKHLYKE